MSEQVVSPETPSSLLSLSIAAASAARIPVVPEPTPAPSFTAASYNGPSSLPSSGAAMNIASAKLHSIQKHRRMSSAGSTKRRLSDAREAATRPSAVTIQTAAAALSSLATLSLSGSPPPQALPHHHPSTSFSSVSGLLRSHLSDPSGTPSSAGSVRQEDEDNQAAHDSAGKVASEVSVGGGISIRNTTGKKRGTIFKCESCSKVYRHPSCLIKHRWEHSPHWREASKFLLSKHQQVQLLEAAAILSHISPSASGGTSLPEDRSLWPSFLSGGLLPPPSPANALSNPSSTPSSGQTPALLSSSLETHSTYPISSSVPAPSNIPPITRSTSTGPRLHDYSIPASGGVTHVRPGVLGIPTGPEYRNAGSSALSTVLTTATMVTAGSDEEHSHGSTRAVPVPVPFNGSNGHHDNGGYRDTGGFSFVSGTSVDSWGSPVSLSVLTHGNSSSLRSSAFEGGIGGGWSLPRSSVRSGGSGSQSRSRSGSASKSDEDEEVDEEGGFVVDLEMDDGEEGVQKRGQRYGFVLRGRPVGNARLRWRRGEDEEDEDEGVTLAPHEEKIEEEWDGMDMDMEM